MNAPDLVAAMLSQATAGMRFLSPEEAAAERIGAVQPEIAARSRLLKGHLGTGLAVAELNRRVPDARLRTAAESWSPSVGSLLIIGPAGSGKTEAARRIGRKQLRAAWLAGDADAPIVGALWTSALELTRALRDARLGTPCDVFREAQRVPLLFLDELGQENHDARWLIELLDARYAPRHRPTITTSGFTPQMLEERYGAGAVRRLVEPRGQLVNVHGGRGRGV
jgi:DNA replication protein DnaC